MSFSSRPTEVVTVYLLCIFSSPFDQNLHWIAVRSYYRHSIVIDIALISLIVMCSLKLIVISLLQHIQLYCIMYLCIIYRHPGHCEGLAALGGPGAATQVSQPHCDHHLKTRRCSLVWVHQTSGSVGANSPLGRPPGRGLWKEARQVRGTSQRVSTSRMESKVSPNRGRKQGLCGPIPVQSLQSVRHRWSEEEKSYL